MTPNWSARWLHTHRAPESKAMYHGPSPKFARVATTRLVRGSMRRSVLLARLATHTAPGVTKTWPLGGGSARVATTRLVCGSMRVSVLVCLVRPLLSRTRDQGVLGHRLWSVDLRRRAEPQHEWLRAAQVGESVAMHAYFALADRGALSN